MDVSIVLRISSARCVVMLFGQNVTLNSEAIAKLLLAFATWRLGVLEIWRKLQKISETPRLLFSQQRKQTVTLRNQRGFATGSSVLIAMTAECVTAGFPGVLPTGRSVDA